MPATMDAFIAAVEDARRRLIQQEGQQVSFRELIRRAQFTDRQRPGVAYHLNPNRHTGEKPHMVPVEMIQKLASVLPITEEELSRAAAVAAGYNVVEKDLYDLKPSDVSYVVARFFGDEEVTDAERQAVTAEILRIVAEQARRDGEDDKKPGRKGGKKTG